MNAFATETRTANCSEGAMASRASAVRCELPVESRVSNHEKSDDAAEIVSLRAALQTLGDDGASKDLFSPLPSPISPPSCPRKDHRSHSGRKSSRTTRGVTEYRAKREARNNTLADLNSQIKQLQRVLDDSKPNRHSQRVVLSGPQPTLDGEWEQMSKRQKRQWLVAEVANASLRQFASTQIKAARTVERLPNKAGMIQQYVGSEVTNTSIERYSGPLFDLDGLLGYLDGIYGRTSVVLSSGCFADCQVDNFRELSFADYGPDGLQIELAISSVLPFSVDAIAGALWKSLTVGKQVVKNVASKIIRENSNVSFFNFVSENRRGDTVTGTTHGQAVSRQYDKEVDGSTIILSRIVMRSFDVDCNSTGTMKGDGWIQLQPMPDKTTDVTRDATRVRWCRRAMTRPQSLEKLTAEGRSLWVDAMVSRPMRSHWQKEMEQDVQTMESLALHPSPVDTESICALLDFNEPYYAK